MLWKGVPAEVQCTAFEARIVPDAPNAHAWHRVTLDAALVAIAALKATPCREIEIVEDTAVLGSWKHRKVRFAPRVLARGKVTTIYDGSDPSVTIDPGGNISVGNIMDAVLRAEVEIVSVDGGPNLVRLVTT